MTSPSTPRMPTLRSEALNSGEASMAFPNPYLMGVMAAIKLAETCVAAYKEIKLAEMADKAKREENELKAKTLLAGQQQALEHELAMYRAYLENWRIIISQNSENPDIVREALKEMRRTQRELKRSTSSLKALLSRRTDNQEQA